LCNLGDWSKNIVFQVEDIVSQEEKFFLHCVTSCPILLKNPDAKIKIFQLGPLVTCLVIPFLSESCHVSHVFSPSLGPFGSGILEILASGTTEQGPEQRLNIRKALVVCAHM
jgi:hypothetical protein